MLKLLALAFVVVAVDAATGLDSEWAVFKATYDKKYSNNEEQTRKAIWTQTMKSIDEHNARYAKGLSSFYMGENQFSDMANSEYAAIMTGSPIKVSYKMNTFSKVNTSLPDTVDWRQKGYVTEVKDQGLACGSCYAFSTTGSLEGQHFKATGKLVSLSEGNVVDCTVQYGNFGCGGGFANNSFRYIIDNNGIDTEASYPYVYNNTLPKGQSQCGFSKNTVGATMSSYQDVEAGSESDLQEKVATIGPISVAIDACHPSFQSYKGGVYYEPECSSTDLGHAVLVVGYGTHHGNEYWLVKNSYGKTFGMEGYIMMSRNVNNNCGIATAGLYPIV